jgi:hypothetical protein
MAKKKKSAKPLAPRPHHARTPDVAATRRPTVADTFDRTHDAAPAPLRAGLGGTRALDLAAPTGGGMLDAVLEVVGAESLTLREALTLWQREQDRLMNRAWRRPGGLTRPAGL